MVTLTWEHECKVRMTVELMDTLCTRDDNGNRLRVEWGEPDAEGFYCPTIHVDYEDNSLRKRLEKAETLLARNIRDRVVRLIGQGYRSAEEQQPFFPDIPSHVLDMVFAEPFIAALAKEESEA